ncbi:MAG TPA: 4Fe-4S binding protein [Caldisericia bacterium]|nr:4Fe-4S binding protein [Caldisericia bacterium]HPF48224.1 4Fe-4S binding protein [Caldisericia bacterium]HPI83840.1 4Fe-4S binding protein [Caldisericia bacterium]HPQ92677.1 4Fe-4S binding protein [Caldisericia bacterium]HRV74225.1 4Fe-4S binding protein [Caldisericia bacterium]
MPTVTGKIEVNDERCKACGLCVEVCPKKILKLSNKINSKGYHPVECTDMDSCIACTSCALICPDVAITVFKN